MKPRNIIFEAALCPDSTSGGAMLRQVASAMRSATDWPRAIFIPRAVKSEAVHRHRTRREPS
jgi:hypothetical protein